VSELEQPRRELYPAAGGSRRYPRSVKVRALRGEVVLSWIAAVVGIVGIVSSVTPEMAGRYDLVRGVLPPGTPHIARIAALAFGLALVWLSGSLARRRRRAWQLAVVAVIAVSLAHLAKGLDFEEAALGVLLLGALIRYRSRFVVPGDPLPIRATVATGLALVSATGATLALEARGARYDRTADVLMAVALLVGFRALHLLLRPLSNRVRQSAEERKRARELVRAHGDDSLAFFALRRDKNWFFSPTRRSFLAYRVVGGAALVSGEPIGDELEFPELLSEFQRICHARGWRVALLSIRAELLPVVRRLGLRAIKLGDEAVVRPDRFTLEGRSIRKVRQSVARLRRSGYRFRIVGAADVDVGLRAELERVSAHWRGASAERGFSMAMDDPFRETESLFALAETDDGVGGFLHLVPSARGRGYSLGAMRRMQSTPNGLMEYLVVETIHWARRREVDELSLNFCVFADLLASGPGGTFRAVVRRALRVADRVFQLERLLVFNRKFQPEWRPRYLCVERLSDLGLVGLAYMRVESLLMPPGPWARRSPAEVG
jgi:lysyl-tRNA synthetase, class II